MESYNKSYPKSKNGFQCIGPCYQSNTTIVHPITLEYITDKSNPFCPVGQWEYTDRDTGKKTIKTTDACHHPTDNKDLSGKEFEISILTPNIDFNDTQFLKIYYNIYSFEDAVNWCDTRKYLPVLTRLRIMDCALTAYGNDLNIVDHRTVDFFIEIFKTKWINDIYNNIGKYISIDNDIIKLAQPKIDTKENKENNADKHIKYNYIKTKFINNDEIYKFLLKYIKYRKDKWETIKYHSDNIKNDFIIYLENKIKTTLDL